MGKRLTYDHVYSIFKDEGCELLNKEYVNSKNKLNYKCSCGNISEISFANFQQGNRCKKCGEQRKKDKKRHNFEYIKKYFKDYNCELLENKYTHCELPMKYRCSCGDISKICFSSFQQGGRCGKCGGNEKYTYEYICKYFKEKKCKLLEREYINNKTKMRYKCNCGNISEISFSNFKKGRRCMRCGGAEKYTHQEVYKYFKEQGCQLLENGYINARAKLKYKCSCGNISNIVFGSFKLGHKCKKCGIKKISGKNSPNYKHNITDEERKLKRFYPGYILWRKDIYSRDNYTCQYCFQVGGVLNAHHIANYADNKKLRLDKNNGVTMCLGCHKEFHKKYGKKNINKKQLDEFLKIEQHEENKNYVGLLS